MSNNVKDKNTAHELLKQIKIIVDNYLNARKPTAVVQGIYTGTCVMVGELPVPMSMVNGNMKLKLASGDRVRLLRNDGGREYFILEIIGKRYALIEEVN